MSKLKRGMVDPKRSLIWNLWNYRTSEETRVWSSAHHDVWRIVMTLRFVIIILSVAWGPILAILIYNTLKSFR